MPEPTDPTPHDVIPPAASPSSSEEGAQVQAEARARTAEAVAHTNPTEGGMSFLAIFGLLALALALVAAVLLIPKHPSVNRDIFLADSTRDAIARTQDSLDRRVDPERVIGAPLADTSEARPLTRLAAPSAGRDSTAAAAVVGR